MTSTAESLPDAARRIREMRPIVGEGATDEDCAVRRELIELTLPVRGVQPGERCWFTAQLGDGHICGCWATSPEEAELDLSVWWGTDCHWVLPDSAQRIREEYLPSRGRTRPATDRVFPLGAPRVPRDRFAPAASLLDALVVPNSAATGIRHG